MSELAHQHIKKLASCHHSRIAPTPSGYLHIGNVLNFVQTWLLVRKTNGSLRLRIDDLDAPRIEPNYIEDIFRTLEWLGLDWDKGAQTPDEHTRLYSQQHRLERYRQGLEQLMDAQQLYACTCSRKQLQHIDNQMIHQCPTLKRSLDEPNAAWRIYTLKNTSIVLNDKLLGRILVNLDNEMPDFVVRRKDGIPAYQLACVLDDIDHQINCIVRGEDLLGSSAAQLYLSTILKLEQYQEIEFYHHSLILDAQGQKLSKSAGSTSIKAWRESGNSRADLFYLLSEYLQLPERVDSLAEMLLLIA